ncbi:MAG: hypothetical protein KKB12_02120, partial [Candidatus Omnitrophica bacterium]|nr:hypothetical protein [Candidatus Omnitrophota bacterium]
LSEKTHISPGIIGMIFLAIATSFPEISTAATSVYFLGKVGLGYADIVGSVIINFMILFGVDYFSGKGRMLLKISRLNRMSGVVILLLSFVVLGASVTRVSGRAIPSFMGLGAENFIIILIYFIALRKFKNTETAEKGEAEKNTGSKWMIWGKFIGLLFVVVCLGAWMAKIGEAIVNTTGLSQTFTGVLFLGLATSLPEIIVTFAALRAGSLNMAVGNVLGSNMFDICIIPLLDILNKTPILGMLTRGQVFVTAVMLVTSLVFVVSSLVKKETSSRFNWDTTAIFAIGFAGFVIVYFVR